MFREDGGEVLLPMPKMYCSFTPPPPLTIEPPSESEGEIPDVDRNNTSSVTTAAG